ncbi:HEAT repeat domain-containing protein [Treponema sp. OMZ 840]|uniref:HEAT repeat domain-containing protein n=1 Tax=Treponema sp. OMZ 840 TaxID=244313 RepID=UPI003D8AC3F6
MKISKVALCAAVLCFVVLHASAQGNTRSEVTVEEEYFGTNEDLIISEMSQVDDYETKLLTLQYIKTALDEGRSSPAIETALQNMAGEGVFNQSRTGRRLMNNYTEVRRQACIMLGQTDGLSEEQLKERKNTLMRLIKDEDEPMVLSAAIYALGNIGVNENDEVVDQISMIHKRFSILNPTDSLAYSVLDAYGKLAPTVKNSGALVETIAAIATNYNYVIPVRQKAKELLFSLRN